MDYTVENLVGLLIRSRLMTADNVKTAHQRWLGEAKDPGNSQQFARWLVQRQLLTEYQASLLMKGKVDDFFLNQYQILDRLGRGRMAGVFKAMHTLGQLVAIKVLPPSKAKNPQMLARFHREAKLAMKLKHPNVVRSFQMGEAHGLNFLVMEYLEGETLDEVLQRRKKLPHQEAVRIIHQALMGLQHIHEMGMVHRDLKPANLMLVSGPGKGDNDNTMRATVKILDIGLGREFFDESNVNEEERSPDLTGEGVILGTPDYLAPEQARDPRSIDVRADIYSLGCVLHHLLTGQPPFPDKNLLNQMLRHATETPKPVRDFSPAVPEGLQQVLNWMMAKQANQRYPTPERAAQALQVFLLADSEPMRREDQPSMRKYLTWLETSNPISDEETLLPSPASSSSSDRPMPVQAPVAMEATPAKGAPAKAAPVKATPGKAAPPKAASFKTAPGKGAPSSRPTKTKPATATAAPVANPVPGSAGGVTPAKPVAQESGPEGFDVELVPAEEPQAGFLGSLGLSKRDWILVGVGGGIMVLLLILIVVMMLR